MRRRARIDDNHKEVVAALRACGWTVVDCSRLGGGFPDLLVVRAGRLELIEVKDGKKSPSRTKLTPGERLLHDALARSGVQVRIISTIDEAVGL